MNFVYLYLTQRGGLEKRDGFISTDGCRNEDFIRFIILDQQSKEAGPSNFTWQKTF